MTALEIELPSGETRKLILRQPGAATLQHNPRASEDEFRLLQITRSLGLASPAPVYFDPSGQIFPTPYLVIEYIEGQADFAPWDRIAYVHQAADHLAQIHRANPLNLDLSFLPPHPQGIAETVIQRPAHTNPSLDEGRIRNTLSAAWPIPRRNNPALLHGDYWPGNLLWRDRRLVGVIDWEDAALGDPLADLAISRLDILWIFGREAWHAFTQQYLSNAAIDSTCLPYWDLCAALRLTRLAGPNLAEWAAFFHPYGRQDITEQTIREQYRFFVEQAFEKITA